MDTKMNNARQRDRPMAAASCRDSQLAVPNDTPRLWDRLAGWFSRWGADILLTAGALLISVGAGCIYPPAGLISGGALLIAGGVLAAKGGGGP